MNVLKIPTFLNVNLSLDLAASWRRYFAFLLDWLFKGFYVLAVIYAMSYRSFLDNFWISFFVFMPVYFYTLISEWVLKGQTPAKIIMKIKVVGSDGCPPSFSQCAVRWIFMFADAYSTVLLSLIHPWAGILIAFGPFVGIVRIERAKLKQRFGDLAAGTFVVNTRDKYYTIEDTVYAYATKQKNYLVTYPEVIQLSDKDMTIIKNVLEKSEEYYDAQLLEKLSLKIKAILEIESIEEDTLFLRKLLNDYNYLSLD